MTTSTFNDAEIPDRITAIINFRRQRLPAVRDAIARWQQVLDGLSRLDDALGPLAEQPAVPEATRKALLDRDEPQRLRRDVTGLLAELQTLQSRLARDTLNIGVSGQARVGKSTFLQAVSGLDDEQIPTGSGLPVTAVRSRIFHSATVAARLRLRSERSFLSDVVGPYYRSLRFLNEPLTLAQFEADSRVTSLDPPPVEGAVGMLDELRKMQRSLPTYQDLLAGDSRDVALDDLRGYLAYPGEEELKRERAGAVIERRYLAVEDVRIHCPFPHGGVGRIGLCDLPGLGEIAPDAEEHHLHGLQHEVDAVLMIVRPMGESAFWNEPAEKAMQLVKRVCGGHLDPRDFAFIVINDDGSRPDLVDALAGSIGDKVNEGVPDRFHIVLAADAGDRDDVATKVLRPVLRHLAGRAGAMDASLIRAYQDTSDQVGAQVDGYLAGLEKLLRTVPMSSSAQLLDGQTDALRARLAADLGTVREFYRDQAAHIDGQYQDAVAKVYQEANEWIAGGFGRGEQRWCTEALAQMRLLRNAAPFAVDELNRIRVELNGRFRALEDYFAAEVAQLLARVEQVLARELGALMVEPEGPRLRPGDGLRALGRRLDEAAEPCRHLAGTVADLAGLTLDYRSHVYPWIANELRDLNYEIDTGDGGRVARFVVSVDEAGAKTLYGHVTQAAEQAAYATYSALIDGNVRPAAVLWAAAEYFEDALVRAGDSEREFRALGRSYQNEIWPGAFAELSPQNAHLSRVREVIRDIASKKEDVRL